MSFSSDQEWYLTPQEFADIILDSIESSSSLKRNKKSHPDDLFAAFSAAAAAASISRSRMDNRISRKNKKNTIMTTGNLSKNFYPEYNDAIYLVDSDEDFIREP